MGRREYGNVFKVVPIEEMNILVYFENDNIKKYNIKRLYKKFPIFKELENNNLFKLVEVDTGGMGIVWNENIDLSRYEILKNGEDYT